MEPTQQAAFRLSTSLLERLDSYAERLRREQPGMTVSRSDVVRLLLTRALDGSDVAPGDKSVGSESRNKKPARR